MFWATPKYSRSLRKQQNKFHAHVTGHLLSGWPAFFCTPFKLARRLCQRPTNRAVIKTTVTGTLYAGCASAPQTEQLLKQQLFEHSNGLPQNHELTQVPFFPQKKYQCGPAALATVLQESGVDISPLELVPEIYLPARQGSLQIEILASSRRHGRIAYRINPDLQSLFKEVSAGNPVLVLQNLGLSWAPTWHYAVVAGFDLTKQKVIERHQTSLATFENTWARSKYWGIVVLPPDKLPETADASRYVKTVTALEKIKRWQDANTAYNTALTRWPDNLIAQMGLGNSFYMLKNLPAAEGAFRSASNDHPEFGAAFNNLAQVLLEQGKITEAKNHAQRAIELGGPQLESFKDTLAEINQQQIK
jgi:hypothetical protein